MFENEAKEHCNGVLCSKCGVNCTGNSQCHEWRDMYDIFQEGATFGYNKANEWHNLEENPTDLPKENMKQVIVKLSDGSYEMGYYCIHNNSWWANDCPDYDDELGYYDCKTGEKIYPIKWKEINDD